MPNSRRTGPGVRAGALAASLAVATCAGLAAQLLPLGPESAVPTTNAGSQFAPGVAGEPGGPYLVAWQSADQDGSGAGVYGRLFDAAGGALTGEIRLSQTTSGDQISPAVAWSPAGTFLATWASFGQDGSGFGIYARRFHGTTGQALGDEFQVHVTTAGSQLAPRVAAQGSSFYVAWSGLGAGGDTNDIYARGFAAAVAGGGAGATTGEIRLNGSVSGNQVQPAIAAAGSGLVAAWASDSADGSGFGVVARRFDGTLTPLSSDLAVPQNTIHDQSAPAIAGFSDGGFAVAWQRALQAIGSPIGPQPVIALRRFEGTAGFPAVGPELQVQGDVSRRHELPALVADAEETVTVAWQEHNLASGDKQVVASRFDAANVPLVIDFPLSSTSAGDQIAPALFGSSRLVAAWASFGQDGSSFGVFARRFGTPLPPCVADATTLCLNGDRFRVRATYATAAGASGSGQAVALTADSGYYWFFDDANVEIVVKAIDACGLAGFDNFWLFATGLTNVEVTLDVVDTWTGDQRVYRNPLNQDFQPILDTGHFDVCDAPAPLAANPESTTVARGGWTEGSHGPGARFAARGPMGSGPDTTPSGEEFDVETQTAAGEGSCVANATTLCLNQGRFEVKIDYRTAAGATGNGQAFPLTADSGYFWFFDDANVELVIKVIDGCGFNDRYWVFAGGLTNVETHLTVRDTLQPAAVFTRTNSLNQAFAPILSIDAFATCP
jgi:hypothetical protein